MPFYQLQMKQRNRTYDGMKTGKGKRSIWKTSTLAPHYPSQNPHELIWNRPGAAAMKYIDELKYSIIYYPILEFQEEKF
jgi:hypothetical protein